MKTIRRLSRNQDAYDRFHDWSEGPMLALALAFVPVLVLPLTDDLSNHAAAVMTIAGLVIWAGFVVEFAIKLYLAPRRGEMVRTHKLDALIVALPFLRPLRILPLLTLSTATGSLGRSIVALRRLGARSGNQAFAALLAGAIAVGGLFVWVAEHEQPGSNIESIGDAVWWALVTCTTVGYGDHTPVTAAGRTIAVVLMLFGIAALSVLTANIAAFYVRNDEAAEDSELAALRHQLDRIEQLLGDRGT